MGEEEEEEEKEEEEEDWIKKLDLEKKKRISRPKISIFFQFFNLSLHYTFLPVFTSHSLFMHDIFPSFLPAFRLFLFLLFFIPSLLYTGVFCCSVVLLFFCSGVLSYLVPLKGLYYLCLP